MCFCVRTDVALSHAPQLCSGLSQHSRAAPLEFGGVAWHELNKSVVKNFLQVKLTEGLCTTTLSISILPCKY